MPPLPTGRPEPCTTPRPRLRELAVPTLVVWGDDDIYFDPQWGRWLKDTIAGARRLVELKGGRLFFPEERPGEFNEQLRLFWNAL